MKNYQKRFGKIGGGGGAFYTSQNYFEKLKDKVLSVIDFVLSFSKEDSNRMMILKLLVGLLIVHISLSVIGSFIFWISILLSSPYSALCFGVSGIVLISRNLKLKEVL